jgi:la-related protein 1
VEDFDEVYITFNKALKEIPKSGEVWCEGARLALSSDPSNRHFNFSKAENYLRFAIQFTPQYGDSFLECLRLYMLTD